MTRFFYDSNGQPYDKGDTMTDEIHYPRHSSTPLLDELSPSLSRGLRRLFNARCAELDGIDQARRQVYLDLAAGALSEAPWTTTDLRGKSWTAGTGDPDREFRGGPSPVQWATRVQALTNELEAMKTARAFPKTLAREFIEQMFEQDCGA